MVTDGVECAQVSLVLFLVMSVIGFCLPEPAQRAGGEGVLAMVRESVLNRPRNSGDSVV